MTRTLLSALALSLIAAPSAAESGPAAPAEAPPPASAKPSDFPQLAFLQLPRGKARRKPFPWPKSEAFRSVWGRAEDARAIQVVSAKWRIEDRVQELLLGVVRRSAGYEVRVLATEDRNTAYAVERALRAAERWTVDGPWRPSGAVTLRAEDHEIPLELGRMSAPDARLEPALWTAWTYVATLLDESPAKPGEFVIPMGQCSMDTGPQEAARTYAETCYEAGRMGCFLDFQIRIMGDQFNRVAWSSVGEAAHDTQVDRLLDSGLDLRRFFRGLLARFWTETPRPRELGVWRLARALAELGDPLYPETLSQVAQDPKTDEFNRLRATQVLTYMHFAEARAASKRAEPDVVVERVRAALPELSWSSRWWLRTLEKR